MAFKVDKNKSLYSRWFDVIKIEMLDFSQIIGD